MARPKKVTKEGLKEEIQNLGLNSIKNYFLIETPDGVTREHMNHIFQKAKLGMQFEREMNLTKRAEAMNKIRVTKMFSADKKELKKLIKTNLPEFLPKGRKS